MYRTVVLSTLRYGSKTWTTYRPRLKILEHALPSKDMWSHLEKQVAKHQDPPPLQRHKRGVHHLGISAWLVRPCGAYGRRSYSQGSPLWTAGRVSLVQGWSERCKGVLKRSTEGVQHCPSNMDGRGCEPVKIALDLPRWYSPLRGQPHSPPDCPT